MMRAIGDILVALRWNLGSISLWQPGHDRVGIGRAACCHPSGAVLQPAGEVTLSDPTEASERLRMTLNERVG